MAVGCALFSPETTFLFERNWYKRLTVAFVYVKFGQNYVDFAKNNKSRAFLQPRYEGRRRRLKTFPVFRNAEKPKNATRIKEATENMPRKGSWVK
jgi:hypothetical protein